MCVEIEEIRVNVDRLDRRVWLASWDLEEFLVEMDKTAPRDHKEKLEKQATEEDQENKDQSAYQDLKESLVSPEREESLAFLAKLVAPERKD